MTIGQVAQVEWATYVIENVWIFTESHAIKYDLTESELLLPAVT